jgi:putative Ca2+/H+ antiporter (TMEM165/GDT1 family)
MAFAAKYHVAKVFIGIFLAILLNHGIAVAVGAFIVGFEAVRVIIQFAAALAFIIFGLWTLKKEKPDKESNSAFKLSAIFTVALAFFLAEMGDKTQLAAMALAAKFLNSPIAVLMGTTSAMLVANGLAIIFALILKKKIPQEKIKYTSAFVFILFGYITAFGVFRIDLGLSLPIVFAIFACMLFKTSFLAYFIMKNEERNPHPGP